MIQFGRLYDGSKAFAAYQKRHVIVKMCGKYFEVQIFASCVGFGNVHWTDSQKIAENVIFNYNSKQIGIVSDIC